MIGADAVTTSLARAGVRTVFSLAGAQHTQLLAALQADGVRIIGNRSEDAVVEAADGYARVTGRPGVALMIADQGVANSVAGFATAFEAGSPVVVIMARPAFEQNDPRASPWTHSTAIVEPVTKWHARVERPEELGAYVDAAFEIAAIGRPAPVILSVPADFLSAPVDRPAPRPAPAGPSRPRPGAAEVERAVRLIQGADRPILIAGAGLRWSRDDDCLRDFCETFDLPVLLESSAKGMVDEDPERVFCWPLAQTAAAGADVVIVVGCPLGQRLAGGRSPRFDAEARFIQIDANPVELGRGRAIDVAMVADPATALSDIATALGAAGFKASGGGWIRERLVERRAAIAAVPDAGAGGLHPCAMARRLTAALEGPAIVVGDGADTLNWMHSALVLRAGSLWMDHGPLGSMGVGLPLAIGACAGEAELHPDEAQRRRVVVVSGDGALGYHLAELETMARCELPIAVLVSNDGAWGTERHGQIKNLGYAVNTDLSVARYELAAEGLGCRGVAVSTIDELDAAIGGLFDACGPQLVNVLVDRDSGARRKAEPMLEMIFYNEFALRGAATP